MAARKKSEGIASVVAKQDPVSIQELTMQDFFAAFALTAFDCEETNNLPPLLAGV